MYECYLGQIQPIGFGYAPKGWTLCQGQLLAITQNTALFSLLGTTYGGDGVTTFALPDLRARVPIGTGQGGGLPSYAQGQPGGLEQVTLTVNNMPPHIHQVQGTMKAGGTGEFDNPDGVYLADGTLKEYSTGPKNTTMQANSVNGNLTTTGGNQAHENRPPFIAMNYAIALVGIYPSFD
ncbi:microcystin-dependent protein [Spirosoma oryzae]|uniref:Microcystin-dependent protein n=1 Tax=Spirosoma oryzae TaxID=1469603 RepID=A0A2T0RMN0_9BACT|nr:tail fiber protein [Spirosoma oryzae]PRY22444.1 microcystin-dependent protein [Spirosoma oryzae]